MNLDLEGAFYLGMLAQMIVFGLYVLAWEGGKWSAKREMLRKKAQRENGSKPGLNKT